MSLAMTIFSLVAAWISIAISMLWGMMRIARRHHALVAHNNMAGHAPLTNTLESRRCIQRRSMAATS
ncbi:hypothetical protein CQ048_06160 [Pseudomonas trivialis]|nr:hypothetical protein CQ048_06160 [Pseudomonas trivialis]PRB28511.1 hypothetical protein CQ041_06165 [Pseudomonas sp. MYb60]